MTSNVEAIADLLTLPDVVSDIFRQRAFDEDRALRLVSGLHESMSRSSFFHTMRSDFITAIRDDKIDLLTRVLEKLILHYAGEFSEHWTPVNDSYRAIFRLVTIRSNQYSLKGYEMLDKDPRLLQEFSNELRVLAALYHPSVAIESRNGIVSRSEKAVLLTYNTPLYLLLKERPNDIDKIVGFICSEGTTDGNRIRGMIDSEHLSLSSGYL